MDAIFYNDSNDRFYGGKQFVFTLNGTAGSTAVNNVPFKFLQLSETNGMITWPDITVTPTDADAPLIFTLVPQQFIGTGVRVYRCPVTVFRGQFNAGELYIDVDNQTFSFWVGEVRLDGAIEYLSYRALRTGLEYTISAGSAIFERIFE